MNVFGTYLHGSLLPKNPHFADYLIELALEKRYGEKFKLSPLDDKLEIETHNSLIGKNY
jgi:lipid II isoglutaminyl synthase (glutamine-hydrolysing)